MFMQWTNISTVASGIPGNHCVGATRRIVALVSKEWPGLYLANSLVLSDLDIEAVVFERDELDYVALNARNWSKAKRTCGLRAASAAFFGLTMGVAYAIRGIVSAQEYPAPRHVRQSGVPVHVVESFKGEGCARLLHKLAPDVTVICGTPILPESILNVAKSGTINIHTSILPHYRGGGSLFWPLFFRDAEKVGYTIHRAVAAVDAGPYLYQERIPVHPGDSPQVLLRRCFRAAVPRLIEILRSDPLSEQLWQNYKAPVSYSFRAPTPVVRDYMRGGQQGRSLKVLIKHLAHLLPASSFKSVGRGRVIVFTLHRILNDDTSSDDWRHHLGEPTVAELRAKLVFLKKRFQVISASECVRILDRRERVSDRLAVITVDDGYRDFFQNMRPLLEELSLPASLFVCTGAVESGTTWYQQMYNLIERISSRRLRVPWMGTSIFFGDSHHRALTVEYVLLAYLKRLSRARRIQEIETILAANAVTSEPNERDHFCSAHDLRILAAERSVELHLHSHSHDPLTTLTPAEIEDDMRQCHRAFHEMSGTISTLLSYPNGSVSRSHWPLLGKAGISHAFTTQVGCDRPESFEALALRRNGLGNEHIAEFSWTVDKLLLDSAERKERR